MPLPDFSLDIIAKGGIVLLLALFIALNVPVFNSVNYDIVTRDDYISTLEVQSGKTSIWSEYIDINPLESSRSGRNRYNITVYEENQEEAFDHDLVYSEDRIISGAIRIERKGPLRVEVVWEKFENGEWAEEYTTEKTLEYR